MANDSARHWYSLKRSYRFRDKLRGSGKDGKSQPWRQMKYFLWWKYLFPESNVRNSKILDLIKMLSDAEKLKMDIDDLEDEVTKARQSCNNRTNTSDIFPESFYPADLPGPEAEIPDQEDEYKSLVKKYGLGSGGRRGRRRGTRTAYQLPNEHSDLPSKEYVSGETDEFDHRIDFIKPSQKDNRRSGGGGGSGGLSNKQRQNINRQLQDAGEPPLNE